MIGSFRLPAGSASSSTTPTPVTPYVRPADWLTLPTVLVTDQKVVMLHAIFDHDSNFCAFQCASNYTVDWGDGTTNNYSANVSAYHVYDYNYAGFIGTECSRGYRQAIVTVTPQATFNLTKLDLSIKHNQAGLPAYSSAWLDISMAGANFSTITMGVNVVPSRFLEIFNFLSTNSLSTCLNMFQNCEVLASVSSFHTASATSFVNMFNGCNIIETVPFYNTVSGASFTAMFGGCYRLKEIPALNMIACFDCTNMFQNCASIKTIPTLTTNVLTNCHTMFAGCASLVSVPLFNTTASTQMHNMFNGCVSLQTVPLFVTSSCINMANMFTNCYSLLSVPLFNTVVNASMSAMFQGCYNLQTVPLFNTLACTNMANAFNGCASLLEVPLFNTANVTTMNTMFSGCVSLKTLPLFNTAKVNDFTQFLISCTGIQTLPTFVLGVNATIQLMVYGCTALQVFPPMDGTKITAYNATLLSCTSLSRFLVTNIRFSLPLSEGGAKRLSKTALLEIFGNLATAVGQTITITGNWGADTAISKTSCGTVAGSPVVTQLNTSSLAVGMLVLGTGISTSQSVSFQDTGDTVTLNAHGLVDGNIVSFPTIVTTTGIAINTPYFVKNATTNTFQVSLTLGGSAIALTTDGTGTVAYGSFIQSIITNTSFTLDKPASATGTVTLTSRILDTSIATLKGWTVTG